VFLMCILLSLLGKNSVNTFPRQKRIFGGISLYSVGVISKKTRRLVLPGTCLVTLAIAQTV
jgi:hypothetical protein